MPDYVVGTIRVGNPELWRSYVEQVGTTFGAHGGKVLFRGRKGAALNGDAHGETIVVIEFSDAQAARRWHDSPEYQALVARRDAGADVVLTIYEA
jgi:uncharacterized protein (DUF1330 family)